MSMCINVYMCTLWHMWEYVCKRGHVFMWQKDPFKTYPRCSSLCFLLIVFLLHLCTLCCQRNNRNKRRCYSWIKLVVCTVKSVTLTPGTALVMVMNAAFLPLFLSGAGIVPFSQRDCCEYISSTVSMVTSGTPSLQVQWIGWEGGRGITWEHLCVSVWWGGGGGEGGVEHQGRERCCYCTSCLDILFPVSSHVWSSSSACPSSSTLSLSFHIGSSVISVNKSSSFFSLYTFGDVQRTVAVWLLDLRDAYMGQKLPSSINIYVYLWQKYFSISYFRYCWNILFLKID